MRRTLVLLALLGGGCGGAPDALPWLDRDAGDRRYQAPPTSDTKAVLDKGELTLHDVLALADVLNPTLAAERRTIDVATAAIWDAKLYPNPTLIGQIEDYPTKGGGSLGDAKRVAGLGVPIVIGGRIGAATRLAEKERDAAALQYVWRRREILGGVQRAFVSLLAARRQAALARETRDLAKRFQTVTDERFKAQAVPEMELLKSSVNLAKAEIDLKLAEKELGVALTNLLAAVGDVGLPKDGFVGELGSRFTSPSLEALRGQVASHPLLETAARRKEAAELEGDLARSERIPDPSLELLGGRDGEDASIIEAGVSIPLPLFNRNQGRIAASAARIRKAESEMEAVRNDLFRRLNEAYQTFTVAQDRVSAYQDEILPKAERALGQTDEGHRQGKFSYLDVLDAQRTLAEARIAYVASLADLNLSVAELEKLTGSRLQAVR